MRGSEPELDVAMFVRSAGVAVLAASLLFASGCLGGDGSGGGGRDPGYLRIEELNESERRSHLDAGGPMADEPEIHRLNRTPYERSYIVDALTAMEGNATNVYLDGSQADELAGIDTNRYSYVVYGDRYYWIRYLRNDTSPATR